MKRIVLTLIPCATMIALSGCSNPDNVKYSAITSNLTPEMATLSERPVDVHRNMAVTNNQNLRMFNDDLGRTFYTNHASRLSPYPVTNLSGSPE